MLIEKLDFDNFKIRLDFLISKKLIRKLYFNQLKNFTLKLYFCLKNLILINLKITCN
jgi:hypothetical protein